MNVEIKYTRTGQIRKVPQRVAEALIKAKVAKINIEEEAKPKRGRKKKSEYQTKVMVAGQ